jgi:predicted PurR-regulated permease PerM
LNKVWEVSIRLFILVAVSAVAIWILFAATPLISSLIIAILLAYLLHPIVLLLSKRTRMRWEFAAVIIYIFFLLIIAIIPIGLGTAALSLVQPLQDRFAVFAVQLEEFFQDPISFFGLTFYPGRLVELFQASLTNAIATIPFGSVGFLSGATTNLLWGLVIFVSLYYFLKDGPKVKPWIIDLFPEVHQFDVRYLLDEIDRIWSVFLRVQLLIFVVLLVLILGGSALVIVLFTSGLIPFSTIGLIIMLILVYTLAQQVDNLWLRPHFLGKSLALHPGLVFISLIGALALSGILGALIIVPLMASAKLLLIYGHRKLLGMPTLPNEDGNEKMAEQTDNASPSGENRGTET